MAYTHVAVCASYRNTDTHIRALTRRNFSLNQTNRNMGTTTMTQVGLHFETITGVLYVMAASMAFYFVLMVVSLAFGRYHKGRDY